MEVSRNVFIVFVKITFRFKECMQRLNFRAHRERVHFSEATALFGQKGAFYKGLDP